MKACPYCGNAVPAGVNVFCGKACAGKYRRWGTVDAKRDVDRKIIGLAATCVSPAQISREVGVDKKIVGRVLGIEFCGNPTPYEKSVIDTFLRTGEAAIPSVLQRFGLIYAKKKDVKRAERVRAARCKAAKILRVYRRMMRSEEHASISKAIRVSGMNVSHGINTLRYSRYYQSAVRPRMRKQKEGMARQIYAGCYRKHRTTSFATESDYVSFLLCGLRDRGWTCETEVQYMRGNRNKRHAGARIDIVATRGKERICIEAKATCEHKIVMQAIGQAICASQSLCCAPIIAIPSDVISPAYAKSVGFMSYGVSVISTACDIDNILSTAPFLVGSLTALEGLTRAGKKEYA